MLNRPKVVFLYTEIAEYFTTSCATLAQYADVYIVRWHINAEAPFSFELPTSITVLERDKFNSNELIEKVKAIDPDAIFCSGWTDKGYLKVVKQFSGKLPTVLCMDNIWEGSLRQYIAVTFAKRIKLKHFDNVWVPGISQVNFAKKIGFNNAQIHEGFYTTNVDQKTLIYKELKAKKELNYPKAFLYFGRYIKRKGIFELWSAYGEYKRQGGKWDLICAGTGKEWDNRIEHPSIKHLGFSQPSEISRLAEKTGCYILPSHFEPWGVSVHEMACMGIPLLLSREVGSRNYFLNENKNGYSFESKKVKELTDAMFKIESKSDARLIQMGEYSNKLGREVNHQNWVNTVLKIIKK